jgi:hypothetical protein
VNFAALPWQSPGKGVRYKAYQQGNRKLRLVEFTREFVEPEGCIKGHIGYVLEGQGEVDYAGHTVHYSSGDGVFIPAGEENRHRMTVISSVIRLVPVEDA